MKNTVWRRILALIGATFAVVALAIVPTFADENDPFRHSYSDVREEVMEAERLYSVTSIDGESEWLEEGPAGVLKYNSMSQEFFDYFPSSAGKYILPVEYYKTDESGTNSLVNGFTPVCCPDYFELDYCAIMVVRMNMRGQLYRFWLYAENFVLTSDYDTRWDHDPGDGQGDQESQLVRIEYDVVSTEFTSWWQDATEAGCPDYNGLPWEYWDRDDHVDYISHRYHNVAYSGYEEAVYDTMRLHDTNSFNYTLCYAVVSLEQILIEYESQQSYYKGESDGYAKGQEIGYNNGYSEGEAAGYETGYTEGEAVGWQNGEAYGITQTQGTLDGVKELVFGIFDAPVSLIDGILDFNLFGINFATLVKTLITLAVTALIITFIVRFAKG